MLVINGQHPSPTRSENQRRLGEALLRIAVKKKLPTMRAKFMPSAAKRTLHLSKVDLRWLALSINRISISLNHNVDH
jgi:hypothetical protein